MKSLEETTSSEFPKAIVKIMISSEYLIASIISSPTRKAVSDCSPMVVEVYGWRISSDSTSTYLRDGLACCSLKACLQTCS
uniref:Uncharacterized protein n=1 Tax=Coccidioides posadasii RMSCC 3488 TaxID=454284 RepID=A0A0J6F8R7_COCPO|nr:hypothetical protein CPAG_02926 [Coccidioides posadasii RMSCC 3488]